MKKKILSLLIVFLTLIPLIHADGWVSSQPAHTTLYSDTITSKTDASSVNIADAQGLLVTGNIAGLGNVGIGTVNPVRMLNVNGGASSSRLLLQTTASGSTIGDGLDLIMSTSGDAQVWLYEPGNLAFATSNTERMRIDSAGNVGI